MKLSVLGQKGKAQWDIQAQAALSRQKQTNKHNLTWYKVYSKASIDSRSPNGDLGLAIT